MIKKKDKGRRFEYWIRDLFKDLDSTSRRALGSGSFKAYLGKDNADIVLENLPLDIECKHQERLLIYEWWNQAKNQCKSDRIPVLAFKSNLKDPLIAVHATDFHELVKYALLGGWSASTQFTKAPLKKTKLTVEETAELPFSKAKQLRRER